MKDNKDLGMNYTLKEELLKFNKEPINTNSTTIVYMKRNSILNIFENIVYFTFLNVDRVVINILRNHGIDCAEHCVISNKLLNDNRYRYLTNILLFNELYRQDSSNLIAFDLTIAYINHLTYWLMSFNWGYTYTAQTYTMFGAINYNIHYYLHQLNMIKNDLLNQSDDYYNNPQLCNPNTDINFNIPIKDQTFNR